MRPEAVPGLIATTTSLRVLSGLACLDLNGAEKAALIDRWMTVAELNDSHAYRERESFLSGLLGSDRTNEDRERTTSLLREAARRYPKFGLGYHRQHVRLGSTLCPWDTSPTKEVGQGAPIGVNMPNFRLKFFAASPDPDVLSQVVDVVAQTAGTSKPNAGVLLTLVTNPHLRADDQDTLATAIRLCLRTQPGFEKALGDLDVLYLPHAAEPIRRLWLDVFPDRILNLHGWGPLGGVDNAPALLAEARTYTGPRADIRQAQLCDEAARIGMPASVLLRCDVADVLYMAGLENAPTIHQVLAHVLSQSLGDDPDRWQTWTRLAEEFHGTLAELLETVATVTS